MTTRMERRPSAAWQSKAGKLTLGHFLRHAQNELTILFVCFAQQAAKLTQKPTIFPRATPKVFVRLALGKVWQLGRLLTIVEKLVHGNFQSPSHLFQGFNRGNGMAILHAGNVTTKQARALFNVALGEFL